MRTLLAITVALASLAAAPAGAGLLFAGGSAVPPSVQAFAWRVIQAHCDFQAHERAERSFWAYRARAERIDGGTVYSIEIVSDVDGRKSEPPAFIEMAVAADGGLRLTALRSSFIRCAR